MLILQRLLFYKPPSQRFLVKRPALPVPLLGSSASSLLLPTPATVVWTLLYIQPERVDLLCVCSSSNENSASIVTA